MSGGNDSFTKILLHMDGSNGGTAFTDSNFGGSSHTWTASGATTSSTQVKFGTASLNSGASVGKITTLNSTDFALGSSDFTIDCWFYVSGGSGTNRFICGQLDTANTIADHTAELLLTNNNVISFNVWSGGAETSVIGTTAFTAVGWNHVAGVRAGNTLKLFVNGTQEGGNVAFSSTVQSSSNAYGIGGIGEFTTLLWNGFIDEFRLSVGIARWTSNFTPPNAAYYIGIDANSGAFIETGNSSAFAVSQSSGSAAYLIAGNAAFAKYGLGAIAGTYAETGRVASFSVLFPAVATSYTLTGNPANVTILEAEGPGTYSLTGNAAFFNPSISAGSIAYIVTGNAATFTRDFVNWLPAKPLSGSWSGEGAPISVWTNKSAPATPWTPEFTAPH